jgi:hypothetical protein
MKPVQHATNTHTSGEAANALPITKTDIEGKPGLISFWKPSQEELMTLMSGGIVALMVMGESMPIVSIGAVKP